MKPLVKLIAIPKENHAFICVIGSVNGPYKVGVSENPNKRLTDLQCVHYEILQIHLLYQFKHNKLTKDNIYIKESIIHTNLQEYHIRGEWFDCPLSLIDREIISLKQRATPPPNERINEALNLIKDL